MYPFYENHTAAYEYYFHFHHQMQRRYWQSLYRQKQLFQDNQQENLKKTQQNSDNGLTDTYAQANLTVQVEGPSKSRIKIEENLTKAVISSSKKKSGINKTLIHLNQTALKDTNCLEKEGRNANSNLLRMFFRRLQSRLENEPQIINIIKKKNKLHFNIKGFKEWLELYRIDPTKYVRLPPCKMLFVGRKQFHCYTKVMRILLKDFLMHQAHIGFLTSKKIKKSFMTHNYRAMRSLLFDIYRTHYDP